MSLGRLTTEGGQLFADRFVASLMKNAKKSIHMSLQDFDSGRGTDDHVLAGIAKAYCENPNLQVRIIISKPSFVPDQTEEWYIPSTAPLLRRCAYLYNPLTRVIFGAMGGLGTPLRPRMPWHYLSEKKFMFQNFGF